MYINRIDDLLDKIIDDFYNSIIIKNAIIQDIENEINFVKYQREINQILINYINTINIDEIRELVKSEDTVKIITNIIKRYIAIYFFLTIGAFYKGKEDTFINNIVEFTKNQAGYGLKIENFFNSENNAMIIQYYNLITNILTIVNSDLNKLQSYIQKSNYKEAIEFLNSLGQDYVDDVFRLSNLDNNVNDQIHNIIKTVIILLIYKKNEKEAVFNILESVENEEGEYIFIDIVVPRKQVINYSTIENLLSKADLDRGMANEIWNFIMDQDSNVHLRTIDNDEKILKLINSKILVPITDEFLMYHKDTERYDKGSNDPTKIKKKEDTKIRYIVTKIDRVSEYYSESVQKDQKVKAEIRKLFYMPLIDRKAVLYNNNEEIRIINKLINQGRRSIENNEYYNDLIHFRKYPYINFKEFKNYGFSITLDKTIDIIRASNFDTENGTARDRNNIELRIGSNGQTINIIGFAIPTNNKPMQCLKIKDLKAIKDYDSDKNGYDLIFKYLQQSHLNSKKHKSSIYWLFDLKNDNTIMDTYEQFNKLNNQEQTRYIVSKLYDDILYEIVYEILEKFDQYKEIPFDKAFKIIENVEKRTFEIPRNSDLFSELEEKIFYDKYEKSEAKYDENEDKFFGLSGNVIKLERIPDRPPPAIQIIKLDIGKITQKELNIELEAVKGVCQHNITWENITKLRKQNPGKYPDLLFAFIEKYVIENNEHDYICKSCGFQLNIKKFIIDGVFDDDSERFITFAMPMDVPLEDIPEYQKYITAIRNIDKLIEKIASIVNIPYFLGSSANTKWRRRAVIKDTIDILLVHNTIMKKNFRERNITASKLYGISRDLSNLFIFDLDNSIFVYSSKEKDYFKNIKHNNVIAYIIILMLLEISNSHITFMSGDKKGVCNYPIFEKYGNILFEGLKIRKNKAGDLTDIKRYKVLCYLLYITSCMATRYNLWHYEYPENNSDNKLAKPVGTNKKIKFDPKIQKIIIHTVIDVLNSILEISSQAGASRLYEVIAEKFYRKMRDTFNNATIINMFQTNEKSSIGMERKDFIFTKIPNILLTGEPIKIEYGTPYYRTCRVCQYVPGSRVNPFHHFYHINNITNCPNGDFHNWVASGKVLTCSICGVTIDVPYDEKLSEQIRQTYKYVALEKLAEKYCHDGTIHNFIYNEEQNCNVCIKCKTTENFKFTHQELDQLEKNVNKHKIKESEQQEVQREIKKENENKELEYERRVIQKLVEHYKRDNTREDPYKFIDQFINNIQSVIGTETNINNSNILLRDNIYIIDHDHLGYPLDKPIIITDADNRISFKNNHPFYKTDVIYYTNNRAGRLDVFYDATTHILLGYKENNRDFVNLKKTNKKIKINYSIVNKLKLLGYPSHYINIADQYNNYTKDIQDMIGVNKENMPGQEEIYKEILSNIIRKRINNLKKVISQFQRVIWRIKNNNSLQTRIEKLDTQRYGFDNTNTTEEISPLDALVDKYLKKLNSINLEDDKGNHRIFKHWKAVVNNLFTDSLEDKVVNIGNDRLIDAIEISRYSNNGYLLLYFIVSEIDKMIHFNQNKFVKTNAVMLILDFIDTVFNLYNTEELLNSIDIKRFIYILNSEGYLYDIEQSGQGLLNTDGIYEEYQDPDEFASEDQIIAEDDAEEEAQALDVDMDYDDALEYIPQLDDDRFVELPRIIDG